jgi:purine-binding chemotaxis protein CheW
VAHVHEPGTELVLFSVDELWCGLPIDRVQEIIRPPQVTPVRVGRPEVRGVINLRGQIVTVVDLRRRFGLETVTLNRQSRIVVVQQGDEQVGLLVDKVEDTIRTEAAELLPPPGNLGGVRGRLFAGVYRMEERLVAVLDCQAVLFGDTD